MRTKQTMLLIAILLLAVPPAVAQSSNNCQTKVGKLSSRVKCLGAKVDTLEQETAELRRQSADSSERLMQLEKRISALESRSALQSRHPSLNQKPEAATETQRPTRQAASPGKNMGQSDIIYEGDPLIKVPAHPNGAAGVRGMPDTESGAYVRPPE